jgi:SAM-dependent methyltransferase
MSGLHRRAQRALDRQLAYQRRKSEAISGQEAEVMAAMARHSAQVRDEILAVRPISPSARVLEVGSGAHGLIFFFEGAEKVGVDPLADHYRELFPAWQSQAKTLAAFGEQLPFADSSFDVVLCDNVVDHAENPRRIVEEIARVLAPGGLLYFTVNVHHPVYHYAATLHAGWRALGVPFEITPFADHTVHLTPASAKRLFDGLPLTVLRERDDVAATRREGAAVSARHAGDRLKRWFFKNARWELIAARES